ncbi:MAG: sulfite exporter TauE/SafE family protein [Acidobacteriia bacterium]|nr:sulfite exporter TauE/SafE family protein [Terriglobia bacterium]
MGVTALAAEALALGLSSGPVCLASCAPVLLPVMAAGRPSPRGAGAVLGQFLAGRLAGYLVFASIVWALGTSLRLDAQSRAWAPGGADLAIAVLLASYGMAMRARPLEKACPAGWARRAAPRYRAFASAFLGFASGLTLCPPFVAAGVRAAEAPGLGRSLFFFFCFFLGTAAWFAPSVSVALLRRFEPVAIVARLVLFVLAGYYGYLGIILLGRTYFHA